MRAKLFLFSALIVLFSSCSKYGYVTVKYPIRPLILIPDSVSRIAMANRSLLKKENRKNSVIEAIITGEIAGSDKMASQECLRAVFDRFNGWRGIQLVNPSGINLYGSGTGNIPDALPWNQVRYICDSLKADALLVLEMFDSNSDMAQTVVSNVVNTIANGPQPVRIKMNVSAYWRLYDPYEQQIVDQFQSTDFMYFDLANPLQPPPLDALPKTAYYSGQQYIQRFLPTYYSVRRTLYKRGKGSEKQAFKRAYRKAEVADWQGAAEEWTSLTKSYRNKNAGRACLDLAVAYEVLGNAHEAFIWAQKAYEDYGNKTAREYANHLKFRLQYE